MPGHLSTSLQRFTSRHSDFSSTIYVMSQLLVTSLGLFTSYHNCMQLQQFTSRCITTCLQDDCSLRLSPSPHILFHTDTLYHRGHCSRDSLKSALRPSQTLCNISFMQCFFFLNIFSYKLCNAQSGPLLLFCAMQTVHDDDRCLRPYMFICIFIHECVCVISTYASLHVCLFVLVCS